MRRESASYGAAMRRPLALGSPTLSPGEQVSRSLTFDVLKGTELIYFMMAAYVGFTPVAARAEPCIATVLLSW